MKWKYVSKIERNKKRAVRLVQMQEDLRKPVKKFAWLPIGNVLDIDNRRINIWFEYVYKSYPDARLLKNDWGPRYSNQWRMIKGDVEYMTIDYPKWLEDVTKE